MHEIEAKTILSARNGMNVYRGCTHGCIYCDSRSTCYQMDHAFEDVAVKRNAPELLEDALRRKRRRCMIGTGSMCDPYLPLERETRLTRRCLEVIDRYVFGDRSLPAERLVRALEHNFEGEEELLARLRYHTPKMGDNEDCVDRRAVWLLNTFADAVAGRVNERGGIFRAGTGSAMYYLWHADDMPATPDGRRRGEPLGANYAPSLFMKAKGPVSILQSFAKPNLGRTINGGPLTIEFHDTVFRNDEAIGKVALLVKSFMDLGGHQLQLNTVNRDTLADAQKHPENYRNLIVRVWGWSGYFVELDKCYQDHIMARMELAV